MFPVLAVSFACLSTCFYLCFFFSSSPFFFAKDYLQIFTTAVLNSDLRKTDRKWFEPHNKRILKIFTSLRLKLFGVDVILLLF